LWPFSGIDGGRLSEYSIECPVYGKLVAQTNRRCDPKRNCIATVWAAESRHSIREGFKKPGSAAVG
jgi:hypothetical protein